MTQTARIVQRIVPPAPAPVHEYALLDRILRARGVREPGDLDLTLSALPDFRDLPDITKAAKRLARAIICHERILIVGDYDCDGACSTALAILALRQFGAESVDFLVPNRFDYGYGLSPAIVAKAQENEPDLIVTVDNGVASVDGVAAANSAGIDVIVTDHHLPPEELPQAHAIVNPNLLRSEFTSRALAGVGVIFYVMLALRFELKQQAFFNAGRAEPKLADLLDMVAIGTVADVVPLDRTNRILVEQGLRRIRAGRTRAGVNALLSIAGKSPQTLSAEDIGFTLGPRINAAGRLQDISIGIRCLLADSITEAQPFARELEQLNQGRRSQEQAMREEAEAQIDVLLSQRVITQPLTSLCLYEPHWHTGIIGILAGRLKDRLNIPVIVFARETVRDNSGIDQIRGSARSVPAAHVRDLLVRVGAENPGLLQKFGGHAMAAGLTLPLTSLEKFASEFDLAVRETVGDRPISKEFLSDGPLDVGEFKLETADLLR